MPRTSQPPKLCLHRPSGRDYVRINGKPKYLGPHGSPESLEAYARVLAEMSAMPITKTPTADTTVLELVDAWRQWALTYYVRDGKPTKYVANAKTPMSTLVSLYGSVPAKSFGPLCLLAIQSHLVNNGVTRSYVNHQVATIKRIFKWAVSRELIPGSIHHALESVEGLRLGRTTAAECPPVLPVSEAVVAATLPHLPTVVADMVRIQQLTGARPGEVCAMRPMDIDRTGDVWRYTPARHKTERFGKVRIIYIGPKAQEILLRYLLRPADAYCFAPAESEENRRAEQRARRKTRVQPSQRNRKKGVKTFNPAYDKHAYALAIRRAIVKANRAAVKEGKAAGLSPSQVQQIEHWAPNRLRHTAGTKVRREYGLEAAQVVLGHSRADVTQVYAERNETLAVSVAAAIG